jgi:hypothetical protein
MKKIILILLTVITVSLVSCKKTSPEPIQVTKIVNQTATSTSSTVRIQLTTTVSASDGKFDGDIQLVTDTVLNTILFTRHFSATFGCPNGSFDTTFVVSSQYLNINTLLFTEKWTGTIFDLDPIADTYMTIWVDGVKKVYLKNTAIAESINLK